MQRVDGEAGRSVLERTWTRPTCDVVGVNVGYSGEGMKTIVPAEGNVKITFRLVPDQQPTKVTEAFEAWLAERIPDGVDVATRPEGPGVAPALTPVAHPAGIASVVAAGKRSYPAC